MEQEIGEDMTIQATCRCGMQFLIEVHEYREAWFMDITEKRWPYRSGSAGIELKRGFAPTRETFLVVASRRLIPLMDKDVDIVDFEDGCKDHGIDYGNIVVGSMRGQGRSHVIMPTPEEMRWIGNPDWLGLDVEGMPGCPGELREGWKESEEGLEGDR